MHQLEHLTGNHVSVENYKQSPSYAVNTNCFTFMQGSETLRKKLKEKWEEGKGHTERIYLSQQM